jgi:hypothetical protein
MPNILYLLLPEILDLLLIQDDLSTLTTLCLVSHATLDIYETTVAEHMQVLKRLHHLMNVDLHKNFSFHYKGFDIYIWCDSVSRIIASKRSYILKIAPYISAHKPSNHVLEIWDLYFIAKIMHHHRIFPTSGDYLMSDGNVDKYSKSYKLVSNAKAWGSHTDVYMGTPFTRVFPISNRNGLLTLPMDGVDDQFWRYLAIEDTSSHIEMQRKTNIQ